MNEVCTALVEIACCLQPVVITKPYDSILSSESAENLDRGRHSLTLSGCCRTARLVSVTNSAF